MGRHGNEVVKAAAKVDPIDRDIAWACRSRDFGADIQASRLGVSTTKSVQVNSETDHSTVLVAFEFRHALCDSIEPAGKNAQSAFACGSLARSWRGHHRPHSRGGLGPYVWKRGPSGYGHDRSSARSCGSIPSRRNLRCSSRRPSKWGDRPHLHRWKHQEDGRSRTPQDHLSPADGARGLRPGIGANTAPGATARISKAIGPRATVPTNAYLAPMATV